MEWSDEGNTPAPVEILPLEKSPTQVPVGSGTYVEITQGQGILGETQTQAEISTRTVELVDSQSLPTPSIERITIERNTEDSARLQEEFIRQLLSDQTTNSTFNPKIWPSSNWKSSNLIMHKFMKSANFQ